MKHHRIDQRSDGWHRLHLGIPTASNFGKIMLPSGKPSGQARKYLYDLCWERLTGKSAARDLSRIPTVQWGVEHEDDAADRFRAIDGRKLLTCGFYTDDQHRIGCSPDRIIDDDISTVDLPREAVELKCPEGPTHLRFICEGPDDPHLPQILGQMLICDLHKVHFMSWRPEAPAYMHTYTRDACQGQLIVLGKLLFEFCRSVDDYTALLRAKGTWPTDTDPLPGWPTEDA